MQEQDWNIGDQARIDCLFTSLATGLPVDPDTVTVKIDSPDPGSARTTWVYLVNAEVVRDGQGMYHFYIPLTRSGTWYYRVEGAGTHVKAGEGALNVARSHFYP